MDVSSGFDRSAIAWLQHYSKHRFTGELQVRAVTDATAQWSLFFCLGRLIWAAGGCHPHRRIGRIWRRHHLDKAFLGEFLAGDRSEVERYTLLADLLARRYLTQVQAQAIASDTLQEVLFDILQAHEHGELIFQENPDGALDKYATFKLSHLEQSDRLWQDVWERWQAWSDAGLVDYSPNLAPAIAQPEPLRQSTAAATYMAIEQLANGTRTLRDIATDIRQDPQRLTLSLVPYVLQGTMQLLQVSDTTTASPSRSALQSVSPMPLVACVDDSPQIHQQMQHTLEENLCRCLSIRDALRALPLLLDAKPDIIFLDVVMPVVNGYELCAQIRRTSALQDVPVVFLTSQDGVVDRLRAKLVGASGFLAKPVRGDRVSEVLVQHLRVPRSLPSN